MSVPNLPSVPPPTISGYKWALEGTVIHVYDPNTGVAGSGAYRAMRPSDFGSVGAGGSSSANQAIQINQLNSLIRSGIPNTGFVTSGIRTFATSLTGNSGNAGSLSPLLTNAENGVVFVQQANLDKTQDSVRSFPLQGATIATGGRQAAIVGGSGASLFSSNTNRNMLFVQNLNTGVLYISLSGAAAINNFNMLLKAGSALDDGNGGVWSTDTWLGSVSVSGVGGFRLAAFEY